MVALWTRSGGEHQNTVPGTGADRHPIATTGYTMLRGWPVATVKGGQIVARDGRIVGPPGGRYIPRTLPGGLLPSRTPKEPVTSA